MTRLRLLAIALLVLAISSCQFVNQENTISFALDGVQYTFTASAPSDGRPWAIDYPCAVGMSSGTNPPDEYMITGSATAADASANLNTIVIDIWRSGDWTAYASIYNSDGYSGNPFLSQIPEGMLDSFITNLDEIGEQFSGVMPGPFSYTDAQQQNHTLENIIFSVERLPDELIQER
jgi:hypothetical protein